MLPLRTRALLLGKGPLPASALLTHRSVVRDFQYKLPGRMLVLEAIAGVQGILDEQSLRLPVEGLKVLDEHHQAIIQVWMATAGVDGCSTGTLIAHHTQSLSSRSAKPADPCLGPPLGGHPL